MPTEHLSPTQDREYQEYPLSLRVPKYTLEDGEAWIATGTSVEGGREYTHLTTPARDPSGRQLDIMRIRKVPTAELQAAANERQMQQREAREAKMSVAVLSRAVELPQELSRSEGEVDNRNIPRSKLWAEADMATSPIIKKIPAHIMNSGRED